MFRRFNGFHQNEKIYTNSSLLHVNRNMPIDHFGTVQLIINAEHKGRLTLGQQKDTENALYNKFNTVTYANIALTSNVLRTLQRLNTNELEFDGVSFLPESVSFVKDLFRVREVRLREVNGDPLVLRSILKEFVGKSITLTSINFSPRLWHSSVTITKLMIEETTDSFPFFKVSTMVKGLHNLKSLRDLSYRSNYGTGVPFKPCGKDSQPEIWKIFFRQGVPLRRPYLFDSSLHLICRVSLVLNYHSLAERKRVLSWLYHERSTMFLGDFGFFANTLMREEGRFPR